jgi:hypothetical protein
MVLKCRKQVGIVLSACSDIAYFLVPLTCSQNCMNDVAATYVFNAWLHVALVYDRSAATATVYFNGTLLQSYNLGSPLSTATDTPVW